MNDGLAAGTVLVFLLDHRGAVGRLALLDDGGRMVPIPVVIPMAFANRYTGASRADDLADGLIPLREDS